MFSSIFKDPEKTINGMSKKQLNILYNYITEYFEKAEEKGLETRDGQLFMAISVFSAIESMEHLVIEAGVGIGKSYAYLIPLLYYNKMTGKPFIISTSTIALQEQLEKDIEKLKKELHLDLDIVVAKGMANFLCLKKLNRYSLKKDNKYSEFDIEKQDRKDYPNVKDSDWQKICVDNCSYNRCDNSKDCEFYKRRLKMKNTSGAIICNHDLLITDFYKKNHFGERPLFRDVDYIVCDEAHNLENKVRAFMTKQIFIESSVNIVSRAINKLAQYDNYDFNYDEIRNKINELNKIISNNINNKILELKDKGIELIDCNGLELVFDDKIKKISKYLHDILVNIEMELQLLETIDFSDFDEIMHETINMYNVLSQGNDSEYLFWVEHKNKKNYIYYAPKNINDISNRLFFNNKKQPTFVFTSATLSTNNDYSYFNSGIGIDMLDDNVTIEDSHDSPYDYDNNALVYACSDIENPSMNKEKYLNELVIKIQELIKLTNGKSLILFTSKSDMNYVYNKIGNKLDDINIYIQKEGSSQDLIKTKFKEDINSVLFSTGAFWEGIDIKGVSLSNLIIARLPFPIVDPIMEYKCNLYGKDGFNKVYLPEMLIKLKQGVGRLIRSKTDTGIVCILDSRLNKKYLDVVKDNIPIKNITTDINEAKKLVKKYKIDN